MRIYDGDFTIGSLLEDCKINNRESEIPNVRSAAGIDLNKLSRKLQHIPVQKVRQRRARLNAFYEEVLVSADPERGISFTSCLMILAHYNIITDSKSLRLEEFLRRRARLQRVEEAVRRNVVIGFFDTLYWSRRFRQFKESRHSSRIVNVPQFSVPEIFVDDDAGEEGSTSRARETQVSEVDIASPPMLSPRSSTTRSPQARNLPRIDTNLASQVSSRMSSPSRSEWSNISPSLSPNRQTHTSYEDGGRIPSPDDISDHPRDESTVSVEDVMESLDNSAWGESIRRSFTMRRPPGHDDQ